MLAKGAITGGMSLLVACLINSGWYVPGEDSYAVAGFAVFARVFYMKLAKPISDYLGNEVWSEREAFIEKLRNSKEEAQQNLTILESFRDNLDVNAALFDVKKKNIKLEADIFSLTQSVQFLADIKSKLHELVAKEKQKKEAERREFLKSVNQELHRMLQKPDVQDQIMQQSLKNLETLPINAM